MSHTCLCLPSYSQYSFTKPGGMEDWARLRGWLCSETIYLPERQSPIPLLTGLNVAQLRWSRPKRYRYTKLPLYTMKKALRETQTLRLWARDGQNLISWRWSLHLPTNPVWWGSMHIISSYRGNRPHTHPPTHPQTGPITIHSATASVQCNEKMLHTTSA